MVAETWKDETSLQSYLRSLLESVQGPVMEGHSVSARMMLMLSVAMCLRSPYEHRPVNSWEH